MKLEAMIAKLNNSHRRDLPVLDQWFRKTQTIVMVQYITQVRRKQDKKRFTAEKNKKSYKIREMCLF
jgi:hypothetical protein